MCDYIIIPERDYLGAKPNKALAIFPIGNIKMAMKPTPEHIGELVRLTRNSMGLTQKDLALTSGTGLRFISELEKGKSNP